jgi:hypothetical protein
VSIQVKSQVPINHNVSINPDATKAAVEEFGPPPGPPTTNALTSCSRRHASGFTSSAATW